MARDTSELKATEIKPRSLWRCEVPGYHIEMFEKSLENKLLDFSNLRDMYKEQLITMKKTHAKHIAKHSNKRKLQKVKD